MKKLLLSFSLLFLAFVSNAQSWTEQSTAYPIASTYTGDISIVDANVAWAMAQRTTTTNHQRYSKTSDGGTTWTTGAIGVGNTTGLGIGNITAADINTAWVSVFPTSTALATQGVYKTINGGTTWTKQATAAFNAASFCNFVYFWDASNGVCMGDKKNGSFEIYTTTNGGTNWTLTPSANIPTSLGDYGYTGKYFVQGNTIWFGTDAGELMKSTDKGLHWTLIPTPLTDFGGGTDTNSIGEFAFKDDNNGVIQETVNKVFYITTDGGATWTDATATTTGMFWGSIAYAGNKLITGGSTTGNFGSSYSTDDGATWASIDALSHTCLSFKSDIIGWGGGFATSATVGGIYKYSPTLGNQQFASTAFKVYPNPASSIVTISAQNVDSFKLNVTDLTGKTVMTKEFNSIENTVDISNFATGLYFFQVNSGSKSETIKIMKN